MKHSQLSVHSENILPIIKKWLYSDKDIFIRELVSNASDALNKVRMLRDSGEQIEGDLEISVTIDKSKKTIQISDTGIGMTEEEVEKYIAQIAFSGAEEFVAKYKPKDEKDPIIGHFGLGFYSAYMVASQVEIETRSYLSDAAAVFWSCDGTSNYSIDKGSRESRGTQITLYLDEQSLEYLEEEKIREQLKRYCMFMPFPISLNGKPLNNKAPLWIKSPADCNAKEYVEFYRQFFPYDPEPLFWIHLNVDYPFHLKGILFFPKTHRRFDSQDTAIKLFCNRVFVSDHCKDILPDYMMVLKGAIDSPDIPLNVSRSYLQVDPSVRQLSTHIAKKIADRLTLYFRNEKEKYIDSWPEIEMFLKLGILQDEKFYERTKELLIWKSSNGSWTTIPDYVERNPEKTIYYAASDKDSPLLQIYKEKKVEILIAEAPIDTAVIQYLEEKQSIKFQRIDGAYDILLDADREKTLLDVEGKTEAARIADFIRSALDKKELEIEAKSLHSDTVPALLVLDETQRRFRDYMTLTQGKSATSIHLKKTFVVNTNSKLIQMIAKLKDRYPSAATEMAKGVYDLSLLSQREVHTGELDQVIAQQTKLLENLASLL
ncbi:MAG TPA: molecular chaperone HtpG [Chlamydiales bacterium]|nr:molecular chaperone HtpG [Chlamydiales bacterium]